ncbi:MAG: copper chaperone PCu(A)C [Luteimonas sp.]
MKTLPTTASRLRHFVPTTLLAAVLFAMTGVHAAELAKTMHAGHAWMRATPPNAPVAGGFVTLHNAGQADDRLVAVSSPDAQRVEIHEMRMDGGVMRMRQLADGIPVRAGGKVELKPGGMHLMFIGPARVLKAGDRLRARFTYQRAATQEVDFAVQPVAATAAPEQAHDHDLHADH